MTATVTDAVALAHVSKRFGSTQALESVDFSVRAGEVHGLVGLNGSGKSTLLKVLSGYVTPAPGATCRLWGTDVPMPLRSAWRHGIASVPQTLALNNSLTVLDNVNVAGALGGGHSAAWRIRRRQEADPPEPARGFHAGGRVEQVADVVVPQHAQGNRVAETAQALEQRQRARHQPGCEQALCRQHMHA